MAKKVVAVNAGPRKGWNTDTLVCEAARGADRGLPAHAFDVVGPTDTLICGDTLQLKDYSKTDWEWSIFDPVAKQQRHDTVFPQECQAAFEKGVALVSA